MAQRSDPAPFLTKTYQLVDDPSSDDVVSWNEQGTTFVVWKTAEFAKDLLPNYFKHNNFSSFVRQLNTYGFRKIASDKWEFANDNFKRGSKELLTSICRRKTTAQMSKPTGRSDNPPTSPANSDLGSGSMSSPDEDSKNNSGINNAQLADLSDENKKLKQDNQMLSLELAQTKKQCDELISFLTRCVRVSPDEIGRIMRQYCPNYRAAAQGDGNLEDGGSNNDGKNIDDDEKDQCCMKLFGVMLKKTRRACNDDYAAASERNNSGF